MAASSVDPSTLNDVETLRRYLAELQVENARISARHSTSVERKPLSASAPDSADVTVKATLKPPPQFKIGWRLEDWWIQFEAYLLIVTTPSTPRMAIANLIVCAISPQAFSALRDRGLTEADVHDPDLLRERLFSKFGDRHTPVTYLTELRKLKQGINESVPNFLDRVRTVATRAYPRTWPTEEFFQSTVVNQFLTGLRSEHLRRTLAELLRQRQRSGGVLQLDELTNEVEANELKVTGKQPVYGSNERAVNCDDLADKASSRFNSDGTAKDSTSARQSPKARNAKERAQKCQLCHKTGHAADACARFLSLKPTSATAGAADKDNRKSATNTKKSFECYRCGQLGHFSKTCHATHNKDPLLAVV